MVSANVAGDSLNYTFHWFEGQNTNPANELSGSPAQSVSGLTDGLWYTVLSLKAACQAATILRNSRFPFASISVTANPNITPNTLCVGGNGVLDATASGGTAPYTYNWYNGINLTPDPMAPDYTGTVNNAASGDYTLLVIDDYDCMDTTTVNVAHNAVYPVLAATDTDQSNCDPANPNGQLSANVGGATAPYRFNMFTGSSTNGADELTGSPAPVVGSLTAGLYTVMVTDTATGCTDTTEVTINDNLVYPTVTASMIAPQSNCTAGILDGEVGALVGGTAVGYTFFWFDGVTFPADTAAVDFIGANYSSLAAGSYTVVAMDDATKCIGDTATAEVTDVTTLPNITTSPTPNTACDTSAYNGVLSADVGGLIEPVYSFVWFEGQSINPADSIGNTSTMNNMAPGIYTVLATNGTTGCADTAEVSIDDTPLYPVITPLTDSDQTACSVSLLDGQVSASVGGDTVNYSFFWFDAPIGSPDTVGADHFGAVYSALAAGRYYVVAKDNNLLCISDTVLYADVADNIVYPVVSASASR